MKTKTKLVLAGLALLLALGAAIALPAGRAEAHNWDNYSAWYCAAHRPEGHILTHSWGSAMGNDFVQYWCKADFYGVSHQYWVNVSPPGSANSWLASGYQKCYPAQGWITYCLGPPGHGQ